MKTAQVSFEFSKELAEVYIEHLKDRRAGSVREDRPWYDRMIARAEALNPDRRDLTEFLMFRAGFCAQWGERGMCEWEDRA